MLDEILKEFIGTDDLRPILKAPHYDDGKVIASNANILIEADESLFSEKYKPVDGFPNYKQITPKHAPYSLIGHIETRDILKAFENCPKRIKYESTECKECDGEGSVICHCCGHEADCEWCNGEGEFVDKNKPIGEYIANENAIVAVGENYVNINNFMPIYRVAKELGIDEISVCYNERFKPIVLYAGGVMMLLMPTTEDHSRQRIKIY